MKRFLTHLFLFSLIVVFAGCASGRKALQKGDYGKAVSQAITRLRANEDHKKAKSTLSRAYKYAVEIYQGNVEKAKQTDDILKWEAVADNYVQINSMYDEILRCPACREVIPNPIRYDAELATANRFAAGARYELGLQALKQKDLRAKAIEAHQHFLRAQNFVPRYKDIEDKLAESLYYATLKVVLEPIPSPFRALDISHEFFTNKINEHLHNYSINPYVRFYTPQEIEAEQVEFVDQIIRMEFDHFSLGNVFNDKHTREVSRDSVNISKKDEMPIYKTVKATLTTYRKSITGGGVLDFKVYDNASNRVITQEKFPSEYTWSIEWANYQGDKRALNEEALNLCELTDLPIPHPQVMFEEFTAPIYNQIIAKIRDYYRGY